ncbi:unnamed protein product [Prorocentrum cordatum]|uniref:Uncharacterized protein n=1 Tax=Prorocentrum cordatum TaxID=2364126 RepID=A0ABN9TJ96_9DINO|nr:unnamed protein product [Polarella glacialis]
MPFAVRGSECDGLEVLLLPCSLKKKSHVSVTGDAQASMRTVDEVGMKVTRPPPSLLSRNSFFIYSFVRGDFDQAVPRSSDATQEIAVHQLAVGRSPELAQHSLGTWKGTGPEKLDLFDVAQHRRNRAVPNRVSFNERQHRQRSASGIWLDGAGCHTPKTVHLTVREALDFTSINVSRQRVDGGGVQCAEGAKISLQLLAMFRMVALAKDLEPIAEMLERYTEGEMPIGRKPPFSLANKATSTAESRVGRMPERSASERIKLNTSRLASLRGVHGERGGGLAETQGLQAAEGRVELQLHHEVEVAPNDVREAFESHVGAYSLIELQLPGREALRVEPVDRDEPKLNTPWQMGNRTQSTAVEDLQGLAEPHEGPGKGRYAATSSKRLQVRRLGLHRQPQKSPAQRRLALQHQLLGQVVDELEAELLALHQVAQADGRARRLLGLHRRGHLQTDLLDELRILPLEAIQLVGHLLDGGLEHDGRLTPALQLQDLLFELLLHLPYLALGLRSTGVERGILLARWLEKLRPSRVVLLGQLQLPLACGDGGKLLQVLRAEALGVGAIRARSTTSADGTWRKRSAARVTSVVMTSANTVLNCGAQREGSVEAPGVRKAAPGGPPQASVRGLPGRRTVVVVVVESEGHVEDEGLVGSRSFRGLWKSEGYDQEELDPCDGHVKCHTNPRHFPQKAYGTGEGGQCLLFLEHANSVPYRDTVRELTCHAVNSRSHGFPSARAWVESASGEREGLVAEWPAKHCNEAPSWYSARPLGLPLALHRASGAVLCLELRDGAEVLGSLRVPLRDIEPHRPTTRQLEMEAEQEAEERCRVTFQLLDSRSVLHHRRVFLVRHGESVWNKAQGSLDLQTMASAVDHPLSEEGRVQAEALGERLAAAAKQRDPNGMAMLRPDVVYVSPLTRAFQTAAIALGPLLAGRAKAEGQQAEFVVMANAREKQTLGGFDTWSTEIGEDVPRRTFVELRSLYEDCDDEKGVLSAFSQIHVDAQEVQDWRMLE